MAYRNRSAGSSRGTLFLILLGLLLATLVVGGALWARGNLTWIKEQRGGNGWYLTYEARSVRGEARAAAVRYRYNPDQFATKHRAEQLGSTELPWSTKVIVNTGAEARVEVTPSGAGIASDRKSVV